jgi:hypothetical protein
VAKDGAQIVTPLVVGAAIGDDHFETAQGNHIVFRHEKSMPLEIAPLR